MACKMKRRVLREILSPTEVKAVLNNTMVCSLYLNISLHPGNERQNQSIHVSGCSCSVFNSAAVGGGGEAKCIRTYVSVTNW